MLAHELLVKAPSRTKQLFAYSILIFFLLLVSLVSTAEPIYKAFDGYQNIFSEVGVTPEKACKKGVGKYNVLSGGTLHLKFVNATQTDDDVTYGCFCTRPGHSISGCGWAKAICDSPYSYRTTTSTETIGCKYISPIEKYTLTATPISDTCLEQRGNPCSPITGNKFQSEIDYLSANPSALTFSRIYNSMGEYRTGEYFTSNWRHEYLVSMDTNQLGSIGYQQGETTNNTYNTPEEACLDGFEDIKTSAMGGALSEATAEYDGNSICKITIPKDGETKFKISREGTFFQFEAHNLKTYGTTSNQYNTRKDACENGFDDIESTVWGGALTGASATYAGGTHCRINIPNGGHTFFIINGSGSFIEPSESNTHTITLANGGLIVFEQIGGEWKSVYDLSLKLEDTGSDWVFSDSQDIKWTFNYDGKLVSIIPINGQEKVLTYNLDSGSGGDDNSETLDKITSSDDRSISLHYLDRQLSVISTPDGDITYEYESGDLTKVKYSDNSIKTYHYNDKHQLTGITDEKGKRFATWTYNSYDGKVRSSTHARGVEYTNFFGVNDTKVSGPLSDVLTYNFTAKRGAPVVSELTGDQCTTCPNGFMKTRTYDDNGYLSGYTDWQGNKTTIVNNLRGLPISQTDVIGTPEERNTSTTWHSEFNLPLSITKPQQQINLSYDSSGKLLSREVSASGSDSRTTSYTYHPIGANGANLIATIDAPRTDVSDISSYAYNTTNDLISITNSLGHITSITSHDASGRPLTITDANGVESTLTWDLRGRLISTLVDGHITVYTYDPVGKVIQILSPDASTITFEYDDAHRLKKITDKLGKSISYDLDAMGNLIASTQTEPGERLFKSYVYDKLSNLQKSLQSNGQYLNYTYDNNQNILSSTNALDHQTQYNYDALDRLIKSIDPDAQETNFEYDNQDNLTKVTDAKGLETTYAYNGFDEVIIQTSPDTGTTSYTYDLAGNRTSMTDARGVTVNYSYDALNRLTFTNYTDNSLDVTHTYDSGSNGIGRLSSTADASGTTTYGYDARGNLLTQTQITGSSSFTIGYSYNGADRLTGIVYPSGNSLQYQRASNGDISQITSTVNGVAQTIVSNASYKPFGPLNSFTYGNALDFSASFDRSWRLKAQVSTGIQGNSYNYNTVDNLVSFNNSLDSTLNQQFDYDPLDRLTNANGTYGSFQYVFDVVGNRIQKNDGTNTDNYTYANTSHYLQSISGSTTSSYQYDAVGNTINNGDYQFSYADNNRLQTVKQDAITLAQYSYNALGQRSQKRIIASGTVTPPPTTEPQSSTVYGDAEEGDTVGWGVYDNSPTGATISNVFDTETNSNVIEFNGDSTKNGYRLGHNSVNNANAWGNTSEKVISWDSKFTDPVTVYIGAQTTLGFRYIYYSSSNSDLGIRGANNNYIHHGLGTSIRDGQWHTTTRDLEADLQEFEPANQIISINGFLIRGSGRVDNIALLKNLPPVPPLAETISYEDAENGDTEGWSVYDNTPEGATVSNVFDADKNSHVIELMGNGTQNGYRLGHNNAANARAWGNTTHKTISWDSNFSENMVVYIGTQTTLGFRYIYYSSREGDLGIRGASNNYIHHGLGTAIRDGQWYTITRDLEADLQEFEPNNQILSVNGLLIRGSGRVDNIKLSGLEQPPVLSTTKIDYIYDQAGRLISETSSQSQKDYIYFDGQPIAMIETGQVYYYHNNHLGSPEVMTDNNQNIVWQASYTPYGEASISTEIVTNNIRLPGQYFDAESGLHYNYFRYYDSSVGRYVTSDPIGLAGGINTYGYVGGNPVNFVDPTGEFAQVAVPVIGGAIAIGACYLSGACENASDAIRHAIDNWSNPFSQPPIISPFPTIPGMNNDNDDSGESCDTPPKVNPWEWHDAPDYPGDQDFDKKRKNCQALKNSILKTCSSLSGRKMFACFQAAQTSYNQCMQQD
ncbi:MAG: RHS repeat-associated core domain-containing protein [Cocleimonas sp.]